MNKSFTLIEILVVIVIIGIISAFIIVSMAGVSDKARIAKGQAFGNSLKNSLLINLVSEWRIDEGSGTVVSDFWGGGNSGTWNGAGGGTYTSPSWRTASECVSGGCLAFDGTDDYINCGNGNNLKFGASDFSIGAWFKTSYSGYQVIVGNHAQAGKGYLIGVHPNNKIYAILRDATTDTYVLQGNSVKDGLWHYVAMSAQRNSVMTVYIDGASLPSTNISSVGDITSPTDLYIGRTINEPNFNGLIDDVRIYNAAIPTSQIQQNYYSGLNKLLFCRGIGGVEYLERVVKLKEGLARIDDLW